MAELILKTFALWSVACAEGIIIGAPHNNTLGKGGTVFMYALALGLIFAASYVLPEGKDGVWGHLRFFGAFPAYLAGLFYAAEGIGKTKQVKDDQGTVHNPPSVENAPYLNAYKQGRWAWSDGFSKEYSKRFNRMITCNKSSELDNPYLDHEDTTLRDTWEDGFYDIQYEAEEEYEEILKQREKEKAVMGETKTEHPEYKEAPSPGELLDMALQEFDGATEENFYERITAGVEYVRAAKSWVDGHLLFTGKAK